MKPQHCLILLGLAVGLLLALLLAPQTRWLVRLQVLTSLQLYHPFPSSGTQSYTLSQTDDDRHIQAAVARQPGNFGLQYARAVNSGDSAQAVVNLHALETRFPAQPALYAGLLRYASSGLHWNRTEENSLYNLPAPPPNFHPIPNPPEVLKAYDRDAAAGERLDPNNAYFSIMRAIGLFAANRDTEGLAAVGRAGRKTEWREYVPEDIEARWHLHEAAYGDPGAFPRSVAAYSTLIPQYAKQRALARLLLYKAVQQEQAGHLEEGFQIRENLSHYGELMRVQSSSLIGPLVGIAISAIATSHPSGVMPPKDELGLKPEQIAQRRLDAYCLYVTRIGHPEAAVRARAEEEARRKVTALASIDRLPDLTGPIFRLAAWWLADLAALANILWLLLLGGLAAALARTRWAQESGQKAERREENAVSRKAVFQQSLPAIGIVTAIFLLGDFFLHLSGRTGLLSVILRSIETLLFLLTLFGLPAALAVYLLRHGFHLRHFSQLALLRRVGVMLLIALCLCVTYSLARWQAGGLNDLLTAVKTLTNSSSDNDDTGQAAERLQIAISMLLVVSIPVLLLIVSGIAARVRRIPISVGIVQDFRAAALPVACLLLLLWGGLLLGTVRQEHVVNTQVWHQVHDEGPYLAAQAGQAWPGPAQ